jgi:hypothetical protein
MFLLIFSFNRDHTQSLAPSHVRVHKQVKIQTIRVAIYHNMHIFITIRPELNKQEHITPKHNEMLQNQE